MLALFRKISLFFNRTEQEHTLPAVSHDEATIVDRLRDENVQDLASHNVTFFYDVLTREYYRIELVLQKNGTPDVVVGGIPRGLGMHMCHRPLS